MGESPPVKRRRGRPRKIPSRNLVNNGNKGQDRVKPVEETPNGIVLPEFFKIYVPALLSNSMIFSHVYREIHFYQRIPPDFLKKFGEKIPTNVSLRMPSGLSWQVHIHQVCDKWFFQEGWQDFVVENSIEDGDFLTFCYVGESVCSVKVYGINGCRKRNASMIDKKPVESVEDTEESESESDDHTADMLKSESPECSTRSKTVFRNPSFSVAVRQYHLHRNSLHVPIKFWRSYLTKVKTRRVKMGIKTATATLWCKNNSWEVDLYMGDGRNRISKGWLEFANDNSVRTGNLCNFELIDSVDLSFNVTISK